MSEIGNKENPLRVAIIGAGPAGFYAAEELLKQETPTTMVDLFDKLPTPYGLVRGGVAPDHQKIKTVTKLFDKTAGREGFRFFGNVQYGKDISLKELLQYYHQVLFCTGADADRKMEIPGEDLANSFPATSFVAWYNGHPDYKDLNFNLGIERVAVVGNGNVAMDVVRILARPVEELAKTDIADYALEALKLSKIKEIYLLGRRGPAQAAFTNPEIRELTDIPGFDLVVRPEDVEIDEVNQQFLDSVKEPRHRRNVDVLTEQAGKGEGNQDKKIRAWFFVSPTEVLGEKSVTGLTLERNKLIRDDKGNFKARGTGETEQIPVDMVFRSIGYLGTPLPEIPFDDWSGVIPNVEGRVVEGESKSVLPRLYVAGWIKRGPSGVVGTNKPCAIATVRHMLEDLPQVSEEANTLKEDVADLLGAKGVRAISFGDWQRLDGMEKERGEALGRVRVKFTSIEDTLAALE